MIPSATAWASVAWYSSSISCSSPGFDKTRTRRAPRARRTRAARNNRRGGRRRGPCCRRSSRSRTAQLPPSGAHVVRHRADTGGRNLFMWMLTTRSTASPQHAAPHGHVALLRVRQRVLVRARHHDGQPCPSVPPTSLATSRLSHASTTPVFVPTAPPSSRRAPRRPPRSPCPPPLRRRPAAAPPYDLGRTEQRPPSPPLRTAKTSPPNCAWFLKQTSLRRVPAPPILRICRRLHRYSGSNCIFRHLSTPST